MSFMMRQIVFALVYDVAGSYPVKLPLFGLRGMFDADVRHSEPHELNAGVFLCDSCRDSFAETSGHLVFFEHRKQSVTGHHVVKSLNVEGLDPANVIHCRDAHTLTPGECAGFEHCADACAVPQQRPL